jgi:hypothetical protein
MRHDACTALQIDGQRYASYRAMVHFNGTTTTEVADIMFAGIGTRSARPCLGSYNRVLYPNVAALFALGPFKVSQNSEFTHAVCCSFKLLAASCILVESECCTHSTVVL